MSRVIAVATLMLRRTLAGSLFGFSLPLFAALGCEETFVSPGDEGGAPSGGTASGGAASGGAAAEGGAPGPGGAASGGAPSELPIPEEGLLVWLRADREVEATLGLVTRWRDLSGSGNDATPLGLATRPRFERAGLDGKPTVAFDGIDDALEFPDGFTFEEGVSIFAVASYEGAALPECSMVFEAANGSEIDDVSLGQWQSRYIFEIATDYLQPMNEVVLGAPFLLAGFYRDSLLQIRRDGDGLGSLTGSAPAVVERTLASLGRSSYASCTFFTGNVSELLVYGRSVSPEEVAAIEAALSARWLE